MDPSTFRFAFTLKNKGAAGVNLRPIGGPWAFFRRVRILAGNQIIEGIDQYHRVHETRYILQAEKSRANDGAEALDTRTLTSPGLFQRHRMNGGASHEVSRKSV